MQPPGEGCPSCRQPVWRRRDAAGATRAHRGLEAFTRGVPGPRGAAAGGQKDGVSCGGVGTCRRGCGGAPTRGERALLVSLGRAAGARQSQACGSRQVGAALGTATRCHPRQVTASVLPGSWQLQTSRLRGEVSVCPEAERSFPLQSGSSSVPCHPIPATPWGCPAGRGAQHGTADCLAQGHPAGRWPSGEASLSPPAAAWQCPRFASAIFPLQTSRLPLVCPLTPTGHHRWRSVGH